LGDNGNATRVAQIADTSKAKGTIYQYGIHVPFFIWGPDVVNAGRSTEELVNTHDLFATILEMFGDLNWQTGIPINKPVDSRSMLPILKNQTAQIRDWSFAEMFKVTPDSADGKAIRNAEYKLLNFDDGHQEFYHLTSDYYEINNLLNGSLNSVELSNYNYLCTQLSNLVGTGNYCTLTSVLNITKKFESNLFVPNPFHDFLKWSDPQNKSYTQLKDSFGKVIYSGTEIESVDFSFLTPGIYFAVAKNGSQKLIKINK
jgi:hypothetical protein